ncbi:hypothetical protein BPAE_0121g00040 [Botrytis paeoniae]|uniref:Uncharacterized protein n=1 Tax=Botrytis paeoniae TaxID=278948 RepID=A0A4Z1FLB7_9HELO|nr:hypothetical protein BPAE_0121g00040 [Botrytis paeoniae]
MSEQSEYNHQASEAFQDNDFPENFDDLFNKAYEEEAAAAALASEPQASATLAENGQVEKTSEEDGFFYDFETDIEKAQETTAAAVLAPEPQAENGQIDEDAEGNGFPANFNMEFDEAYEREQRAAAAVPVAPIVPASQQQANARLASIQVYNRRKASNATSQATSQGTSRKGRKEEKNRLLSGQWYIDGASYLLGLIVDAK